MKIDGKQIAQSILDNLREQAGQLKKRDVFPKLAIILVGEDPASVAYVNQKVIKAEYIGAKTLVKRLSSETSTTTLLEIIQKFNNDKNIHGIIVQQPLPSKIELKKITNAIYPKKDVDGFNESSYFQMPIAMAVLKILQETCNCNQFDKWLRSKKIAIIGKGETGGGPLIQMFQKMKINPIIIDSKTKNPKILTRDADILISAVGKPNIVKKDMLKNGAILIGLGIFRGKDGKLHGDYEENDVKNIVSFYTPVPGGTGPINVTMLLTNLVISAGGLSLN
jgi:methylenetetrahydrofolate dehydrogenase (NADP+)/methenyltetrahydrofolate cyclohydrolase